MWLLDMAEERNATNSAFANLALVAPRSLLDPGATLALQHLRRVARDQPIARLYVAYLQNLAESVPAMTKREAEQIVPATAGIVPAMLDAKEGARPDMARAHAEAARDS